MMELKTCAFVVTLVSLVTASPYGYGVKGGAGASARAQSSASAGAFGDQGDIPAAIPFGNGFSGSFSKSSSSSSSSSSASSSSSSSSFSFSGSGSGSGGFSGQGTHGNIGCKSGQCPNLGSNEISGNHGSSGTGAALHGLSSANAAAVAGSGASSGAGCGGPSCDNNSGKCSSGNCQSKQQGGNYYDTNNKCTSGLCGPTTQSGPSTSPNDETDDIRVLPHSSKSSLDSKDQSTNYDKTTGHAGADCSGNKCGPSTGYSQPNFGSKVTNSYQNNPQPSNSASKPGYHSPATELETPKQDSKSGCTSGYCNSGQPEPVHGSSPSSYNVPIHGTYDNDNRKPTCTNGICNKPLRGGYHSTYSVVLPTNLLSPQNSYSSKDPSFNYPGSSNCRGTNCNSASSNKISNKPLVTGPVTINTNMPLYNSASLSPTNCNLPNCNPQYATSSTIGSNVQPKPITFSGTAHKVKSSNDDKPIYTDGFGAPAGILKPDDYTIPATEFTPNYEHLNTGLNIAPAFDVSATGCGSSNCPDQISLPGTAPYNSNESHKPRGDQNKSEQKPKYTGGFGGPPGLLKPNEFNVYTPIASKPSQSTSLTHNTPSTSTSCTTPNCFGSAPIAGGIPTTQSNANIPGLTAKLTPSSSHFGGPAGILKPNELDIKPLLTTSPPYQNNPHISLPTTGCRTSNCNGYGPVSGTTPGTYVQPGPHGTIKPSLDIHSTTKLPPHVVGYSHPNEVHKPNQLSSPHVAPNTHFPNHLGTPPYTTNVAGCTTPNCQPSSFGTIIGIHSQSQFGINQPNITPRPTSVTNSGYTNNYDRPIGITNPIAPAVAPISSFTNTPSFKPSGINFVECKTANCAAGSTNLNHPSGSFFEPKPFNTQYIDGPTSKITPNNILYHVPFDGTSSTNCKTSNCDNLPSAGAGANTQSGSHAGSKDKSPPYTSGFGAPSGFLKPNDYSIPSSPASVSPGACSGGSCNSEVTSPSSPGYNSVHSGSHPSTQSSSPQYTGGFGGPSGSENPGDHSYNAPSSGSPSIPCQTANCAIPSTTTSGVGTPSGSPNGCADGNCKPQVTSPSSPGYNLVSSGSYPSTQPSSPTYTGNFGGPSGTAKPSNHLYNIPSTGGNSVPCYTPNCATTTGTGVNAQSSAHSDSKTQSPSYTSGFGAPSGLLKPNDYSNPSSPASATPVGCSGGNCNPQVTSPSSPGYISAPSGSHPSSRPSSPQYTGSFGGPSGIAKPNDHSGGSHSIPCKTANCVGPSTATAGAYEPSGLPGACLGGNCNPQITLPSSPGQNLSPSGSHPSTQPSSPHYTGGFGGPSSIAKPGDHLYNAPSASGTFSPCKTADCALSPTAATAAHAPAGSHAGSKDQSPPYTSGFGAPSGFLKPNDYSVPAISTSPNNHNKPSTAVTSPGACSSGNCNLQVTSPSFPGYNSATSGSHPSSLSSNSQYTGGFTGPSGTAKPGDYSYNAPLAGSSPIPCKTANCAGSPVTPTGPYTTSQDLIPPYTSDIKAPSSSSKPSGYSSTVVSTSPNEHDKPLPSGSSPGACSNGYCDSKVTSPSSQGYDSAPSGSHSSSQPSSPQYTGGFGGPAGTAKPGDHSYNSPSTGSNPIPCKSSNCAISPPVTAGANAQSGSPTGLKDQSPPYTNGFGAPPGLLKPNDYSKPATLSASPNDQTKPLQQGSSLDGCSSGNCNAMEPSPISYGHNAVSNGVHASASSSASAVAYTGGFGGPPGFLKPNDDGKVDLSKLVGGYNQGSHHGAGINNSPHDVFNASAASQAGTHLNTGAVAGSVAGATAYSGSVASANSGSYGFNTHGTHQVGGVKGSSPCGGGCGGHQDGLSGSGSSAVAGARSLASAGAFGGSFASSSASAHASAGSYTKGGYGKR